MHACEDMQRRLVEAGGELDAVSGDVRHHVAECAECASVARDEAELAEAFTAALPRYDERLEWAVLAEVARAAARRRVYRLIPAAAALVIAMLGVFLSGGVPGSGLLSALPAQCADGVLGLGATVTDGLTCVTAAIGSLAELVPGWLAALCGLLAIGGVVGLRRAALRLARVKR